MKTNLKMSLFSRFLLWHGYATLVKIWKWLKLLNFVPFIKKTLVNHVYNRIWSFWLAFEFLKFFECANFKMSQFSRFLLRREYVILVKIWKCSKLLNFVLFIKKTHVNHVYNRISLFGLTFAIFQSMKTNFTMSLFSRFLQRCQYAILVKLWKWPKLPNFVPFIKKTHINHVYNGIWSVSHFYSHGRQTSKWVYF